MTELVTGEAVLVEVRLARLASRAVALGLDMAVQLLLFLGGMLGLVYFLGEVDQALQAAVTLVWVVLILVGYPVTFETLTRGRSAGKLAMGLRVVRDDGGPIRFRHALVRGLAGVVDFYATSWSAAVICSLLNARGKRIGDLLAGTVVVRERMPAQGGPMAQMPPQLAGWATTVEVAALPDDLALAARQYLARAHQLDPAVREHLGSRLAEAVRVATGAWPPPGVPAWAYLSAVLAERRRRELARMQPPGGPQPWQPAAPAPQPQVSPAPWQQVAPAAQPPADGQARPPAEDPFRPPA